MIDRTEVEVRLSRPAAEFLRGTVEAMNGIKVLPEGSDQALETSAWLEEIEASVRAALDVVQRSPQGKDREAVRAVMDVLFAHDGSCGLIADGSQAAAETVARAILSRCPSPQGEDHEDARRAIADAVGALDIGMPGEAWLALKAAMQRLEAEEGE